jgi:hypothetical protein
MTYNPYFDSMPRRADKWIPRDTSEIDINDERELLYWSNELRISIGDLMAVRYGTRPLGWHDGARAVWPTCSG